jgi:hypothetical protein
VHRVVFDVAAKESRPTSVGLMSRNDLFAGQVTERSFARQDKAEEMSGAHQPLL